MRADELKAKWCAKCPHVNPCAVCLVNAHIKDAEKEKVTE